MIIPLLLMAGLTASTPFPIDAGADPDLNRLREAWSSHMTIDDERATMRDRLVAEATKPNPDWRAVADDYFAWRNVRASARDTQNSAIMHQFERARVEAANRPAVCTTETRSEQGLYGTNYSTSKTTCSR